MRKGFTLAEVLITLVIIGVIAAMTIPALMSSTGSQEYIQAFKKAFSTLNQIAAVNAVTGDYTPEELGTPEGMKAMLEDKLATVATPAHPAEVTDAPPEDHVEYWIYTTDNIRYGVVDGGMVFVDVNGDKGPNRYAWTWEQDGKYGFHGREGDVFRVRIKGKKFLPADNPEFFALYGRPVSDPCKDLEEDCGGDAPEEEDVAYPDAP